MPKTSRYRQQQNNYYDGNGGFGRNQRWAHNNENNYQARYYEDYGTGYNNNYRSRWHRTHNTDEGNYRRNNYSSNNWKSRQNYKHNNYKGQNQQKAGKNNKPNQSATVTDNRLLAALDKTAESVTNNDANGVNRHKLTQSTTAEQTAEKEQSRTPVLKKEIQTTAEVLSPKQLRELQFRQYPNDAKESSSAKKLEERKAEDTCDINQPKTVPTGEGPSSRTDLNENFHFMETTIKPRQRINFQEIKEEVEIYYKTARYAQKAAEHQETDTYDATTVRVIYDEVALKEMELHRTLQAKEREELIKKTKETRVYKVYKEQTKETVLGDDVLKTPDISIAASRWKESYFKPWKLELAQFGYRFLDRIDSEDDGDIDG